ncbi:MAG: capsule assembly Wzi family protein [Kangiellaceae bacterium]|nr:capsule assembly Wzi family protein [Kangiellaceae bacterium]MCW9000229.1 capsule assembly Wzi family protein [Kangiellaceae bacterium]MCW9018476.1 capsule assembly Wzi family protein [Kangiellaceae bacterium]
MKIRSTTLCSLVLLLITSGSAASPWIGTNNASLHDDLKTLVDYGYLDSVSMTYPMPWQSIAGQLKDIQIKNAHSIAQVAFNRLNRQLRIRRNLSTQIRIKGSNEAQRFTSFKDGIHKRGQFRANTRFETDSFAGQLGINVDSDGEEGFDQSYLAYRIRQWQFSVDSIDRWWGPAESTSFILTNNARPVPGLSVTTSNTTADEASWLKYLGPWYFSAHLGELESDRHVPNTKLWKTRFNFRPFENFEVGLTWSAMWGGEGFANGFSDFIDVITFRAVCADGSESCDEELHTKPGNHLAGVDLKYTFDLFKTPTNFYVHTIGEDAKDFYKITDRVYLFGFSGYAFDGKWYIENSDTGVSCGSATSTTLNCFYEHGDYQSGYRHYSRSIGSTFDSDAKVTSLGYSRHFSEGHELEIRLDIAELNYDAESTTPVVKGDREDLTRLSAAYKHNFNEWSVKLGLSYENSEYEITNSNTLVDDSNSIVSVELSYDF